MKVNTSQSLKRHALLLGSTKGEVPLPMVKKDLEMINVYLRSIRGGAWENNEITFFCDKSYNELKEKIKEIKYEKNDFVFFYWSGHGGYDQTHEELHLEITPDKTIRENEISHLAGKQLSIFDTCSSYIPSEEIRMSLQRSSVILDSNESYDTRRILSKKIYSDAVNSAVGSYEKYYSSQKGQPSNADSSGSVFTKCLVETAKSFSFSQKEKLYIPIASLFEKIEQCCYKNKNKQVPRYEIAKSNYLFPFRIDI